MNSKFCDTARRFGVLAVFFCLIAAGLPAGCGGKSQGDTPPTAEVEETPKPTVVYLIVDGLRADSFWDLASTLPQDSATAQVFGKALSKSAFATGITTVFPTITFPANATLVTGLYPGEHSIVGNRYLNRETGISQNLDTGFGLGSLSGGLGDPYLLAPTIYERFQEKSLVVFHHYTKGAISVSPSLFEASWLTLDPGYFDYLATKRLLEKINRYDETNYPKLITLYWPGLDEATHQGGVGAQAGYLSDSFERNLNYLLTGSSSLKGLAKWAGGMENLTFVLASDHGMVDAHQWISAGEIRQAAFQVLREFPAFQGVTDAQLTGNLNISPNGSMAHLYLKRPQTSWSDRLNGDEEGLVMLEAAARGLLQNPLTKGKLLSVILPTETPGEFLVYRKGADDPVSLAAGAGERAYLFNGIEAKGGDLILLGDSGEGASFLSDAGLGGTLYAATHGNLDAGNLFVPLAAAGRNVTPGLLDLPDITLAADLVLSLAEGEEVNGEPTEGFTPSLLGTSPAWAAVGKPYTWRPVILDPASSVTGLEIYGEPIGMTFENGEVSWTPGPTDLGEATFTLRAKLAGGGWVDYPETVSVRPGEVETVSAKRQGFAVLVTFQEAAGASGYKIRRFTSNWWETADFEISASPYTDTEPPCAETAYLVTAVDGQGRPGGQHVKAVVPAASPGACQ